MRISYTMNIMQSSYYTLSNTIAIPLLDYNFVFVPCSENLVICPVQIMGQLNKCLTAFLLEFSQVNAYTE